MSRITSATSPRTKTSPGTSCSKTVPGRGARGLHTVMERLLETVSFDAAEKGGSAIEIDARYVDDHLGNLAKDEDLSRYIL